MSVSVVPAYRVVAKFARLAIGLNPSEAGDVIEQQLRPYVKNLLSNLHPSFLELGERAAITHLGDPNPDGLVQALSELEYGGAKEIAEQAIQTAEARLQRPDINARVVILPGDGESSVLVQQMRGVLGFSLGAQVVLTFVWPTENWQQWLEYTMTHEYAHLVRNHLFPRGLAGGRQRSLRGRPLRGLGPRRQCRRAAGARPRATDQPRIQRRNAVGAGAGRPLSAVVSEHGRGLVALALRAARFRIPQCPARGRAGGLDY